MKTYEVKLLSTHDGESFLLGGEVDEPTIRVSGPLDISGAVIDILHNQGVLREADVENVSLTNPRLGLYVLTFRVLSEVLVLGIEEVK